MTLLPWLVRLRARVARSQQASCGEQRAPKEGGEVAQALKQKQAASPRQALWAWAKAHVGQKGKAGLARMERSSTRDPQCKEQLQHLAKECHSNYSMGFGGLGDMKPVQGEGPGTGERKG